ncbi:putative protein phosphatase 2C-like protein 44 [Camellia lanceoleosa]|uniref:Uncharacterized protein n=1 Tax=Camellia lanceoleosa TaxID=1840588 RepID=A0ACC0GVE6_9ERIC|nr:putative protein phosphatase 2C-like protein 44 [Camellia lanceoleosa]
MSSSSIVLTPSIATTRRSLSIHCCGVTPLSSFVTLLLPPPPPSNIVVVFLSLSLSFISLLVIIRNYNDVNGIIAFRVRRFFNGDVSGNGKRETEFRKRPSWMVPGSHGYYVVDDHCEFNDEPNLNSNSDSVVVQKEQIEDLELWFFEVSNAKIGDSVTKYMQSHLFDKKPKPKLRRKSKETLTKAYLGARAKIREAEKAEETWKVDSASAIVINGERHVMANMGEYRAVVCRDGEAHPISWRQQQGTKRHWSLRFILGMQLSPPLQLYQLYIMFKNNKNKNKNKSVVRMSKVRTSKSSEVVVGDERIDSDTEFVILASNGIWKGTYNTLH